MGVRAKAPVRNAAVKCSGGEWRFRKYNDNTAMPSSESRGARGSPPTGWVDVTDGGGTPSLP